MSSAYFDDETLARGVTGAKTTKTNKATKADAKPQEIATMPNGSGAGVSQSSRRRMQWPMSSQTDQPKRPRGRPPRNPNDPPKPLTDAEREQRRAALAARWGNRGESSTVRVDKDAAAALSTVPERDRRRVASDAIRAAVAAYISA